MDRLKAGYVSFTLGLVCLGFAHYVLLHGPTSDGVKYIYASAIHLLGALPLFGIAFVVSLQTLTARISAEGTIILRILSAGAPVLTILFYKFVMNVLY